MPKCQFLPCPRFSLNCITLKDRSYEIFIFFLAYNVYLSVFTFNSGCNFIHLIYWCILIRQKPFMLWCELVPLYTTCAISREYTEIFSTGYLHSIDMLDNRIYLIVLNIKEIFIVNKIMMDEYNFNSIFTWFICVGVIELFGNKLFVRIFDKKNH